MPITTESIRQALSRYLDGKIDLDTFEDWIAQNTWNVRERTGDTMSRLVADIELSLAEYSEDHISLDRLRSDLQRVATELPVVNVHVVPSDPLSTPVVINGSSTIPVGGPAFLEMGGRWFGISPEEAHALAGSLQSSHQSSAGPPLACSR